MIASNVQPNALPDRTAVITGATSGIGFTLAETFAAAGCKLAINGVATAEEEDTLINRLEQRGAEVLFHPAELQMRSNASP